MIVHQVESCLAGDSRKSGRKAWSKPSLARLRSGSAENIPGDAIIDGTIEGQGS